MAAPLLSAVRLGRCFVRPGDLVHVRPSRPNRRDGFEAVVRRILGTDPVSVEVVSRRNGHIRTVFVERIQRRSQAGARRDGRLG